MKYEKLFLSAVFAAASVCAAPSAKDVVVALDPFARTVKVDYVLEGGPAVVTARFAVKGEAVPGTNATSVVGDVQRLVSKSAGTFVWNVGRDFPGKTVAAGDVTVALSTWPVDAPPDWMVVDACATGGTRYYENLADVPGGIGPGSGDLNRTTKIVLRHICAAGVTFREGSPTSEIGRDNNEVPHLVTLSEDYYFAVYPVTQAQWKHVMNNNTGSRFTDAEDSPLRPMNGVTYNGVRGASPAVDWPTTGNAVGASSFLGILRDRTGVDFDLPTEAQWEYAARAGASGAMTDGTANLQYWENVDDVNMKRLGWIKQNAIRVYGTAQTGPVGYFLPNNWDIYDVHGNVYELCRDWFVEDRTTLADAALDPKGATTGSSRSFRAGVYAWNVRHCRLARRGGHGPGAGNEQMGFRLYAPYAAK